MDNAEFILTFLTVLTYIAVGLCLGSFASAIAYRIAHHRSWIVNEPGNTSSGRSAARSSCPSCHHQLSALDLIPVFSWVFLGGRCRYCKTKISARYPMIEASGALAMVLFFLLGGMGIDLLVFIITLPFLLALILLLVSKFKPPFYIYGLSFSNVFVLLYAVIWGK